MIEISFSINPSVLIAIIGVPFIYGLVGLELADCINTDDSKPTCLHYGAEVVLWPALLLLRLVGSIARCIRTG